jgi:DNA invertase Pin-like site-specific DNA recombinase
VPNILAGVAAYEREVRAERILAGRAAARERGVHQGGAMRGLQIEVTVEPIMAIRRLRSERGAVSAIVRSAGLTRPTDYHILSEDSQSGNAEPARRIDCGTREMYAVD